MILGVSLCGPLVSDRPQARRGVEIANELFHAPASGRCGGETVAHRGDRCWCVMTRPFKGLRSGNLVFTGCQLFCSCRNALTHRECVSPDERLPWDEGTQRRPHGLRLVPRRPQLVKRLLVPLPTPPTRSGAVHQTERSLGSQGDRRRCLRRLKERRKGSAFAPVVLAGHRAEVRHKESLKSAANLFK
jgi:hypothetical protein